MPSACGPAIFAIAWATVSLAQVQCPAGFSAPAAGYCYKWLTGVNTFAYFEAQCASAAPGGHLASIRDAGQYNTVASLTCAGLGSNRAAGFWIGLYNPGAGCGGTATGVGGTCGGSCGTLSAWRWTSGASTTWLTTGPYVNAELDDAPYARWAWAASRASLPSRPQTLSLLPVFCSRRAEHFFIYPCRAFDGDDGGNNLVGDNCDSYSRTQACCEVLAYPTPSSSFTQSSSRTGSLTASQTPSLVR